MRYKIAAVLMTGGVLGACWSLLELRGSLFGLMILIGSASMMFWGVGLLSGAKNRMVSLLASLFIVALVVVQVALQCSDGNLPFCRS